MSAINTTTPAPEVYEPFEYKEVFGWLYLVVFIIGILGNLSTIIILCRKRWRGSSVAVFLVALAVSDIVILVNSPLVGFGMFVYNFHIRNISDAWCKINGFLTYAALITSSWLLVGFTFERMTNVISARKGRESWTQNIWLARVLAVGIWIFFYAINVHFLVLIGFESPDVKICGPLTTDYIDFIIRILPWLDFTLVFAAPFVLIVFGNMVTIYNLRQIPKSSINTTSKSTSMSRTALTVTLVIVCVVYVITMAPLTFYYIYERYYPAITKETMFYYEFVQILLNLVSNVNAAVNFFLYVISDANVRYDVKVLLRCKKDRRTDYNFDGTGDTKSEFRTMDS